jgi:hypothetical protein
MTEPSRAPYRAAAAVTLAVLAGYGLTLAPTVTFWDAGEFIAAARTLGVPHPPGTPLFVMIAHVWGLLVPVGEYAARTNLLSALFSAAGAGGFFLVVHESLRHTEPRGRILISAAAAIIGAFTFTNWQNSTGALRQPAPLRRPAEQPAMLRSADGELEPDALVAREERQEPVGRGRADDLDPARRLEGAERADQIAVDVVEQLPQPAEPFPPEGHLREQVRLTGLGQRGRRRVTRRQPLLEEGVHLAHEHGARELIGQHRREPDGHRSRGLLGAQGAQGFEQRQVGVDRRLADPVAPVRPAAVVQHVGEMTVEREHEVHWRSVHRAPE